MFLFAGMRAGPPVTDDFWYQQVAATTAAGVQVSPSNALGSTVVYRCVNVLASTIAKLPLKLRAADTKEPQPAHPVARVLARRPNRWQTAYQWRAMAMGHLLLRGNAYSEITIDRAGQVVELIPRHPDRVTIEEVPGGDWRYKVCSASGSDRTLSRGQVLHLVGHCDALPYGMSPIAVQREAIGAALAAQRYAARVFKNNARPGGGFIKLAGKFANEEARAKFRAAWHASQTGENAHSTPVFENGMEYVELGMTNADAQMIETRKYSDTDLCRIFGVPPHKVGVLDRATYSNMEQQNIEFFEEVHGWAANLEQQLQMQLLTEDEEDRLYVQFEMKGVLRADSKSRAEFYNKAIQDGWMTRNEVREREDMEPLEGLDQPLEPLNMTPAGTRDRHQQERQQALMRSAAERAITRELNAVGRIAEHPGPTVAERAREFYAGHAEFLARALVCDPGAAQRWCATRLQALTTRPIADVLAQWADDGADALQELME